MHQSELGVYTWGTADIIPCWLIAKAEADAKCHTSVHTLWLSLVQVNMPTLFTYLTAIWFPRRWWLCRKLPAILLRSRLSVELKAGPSYSARWENMRQLPVIFKSTLIFIVSPSAWTSSPDRSQPFGTKPASLAASFARLISQFHFTDPTSLHLKHDLCVWCSRTVYLTWVMKETTWSWEEKARKI